MASSKWREACKFLAGATFVGSFANAYLWATDVSVPVPFLGLTLSPSVLGIRAAVGAVFFALFLYVGYLRRPRPLQGRAS